LLLTKSAAPAPVSSARARSAHAGGVDDAAGALRHQRLPETQHGATHALGVGRLTVGEHTLAFLLDRGVDQTLEHSLAEGRGEGGQERIREQPVDLGKLAQEGLLVAHGPGLHATPMVVAHHSNS
jgi:hypothetical protein